jgi:hypothetical protein
VCERLVLSIVDVVDFLSSGKLGLVLQQILWRLRRVDVSAAKLRGRLVARCWVSQRLFAPRTIPPFAEVALKEPQKVTSESSCHSHPTNPRAANKSVPQQGLPLGQVSARPTLTAIVETLLAARILIEFRLYR